jgi:hypothetical protein
MNGYALGVRRSGPQARLDALVWSERGAVSGRPHVHGVLLVLLDHNFETTAIYESDRAKVIAALTKPGSRARNERGALSVSKFKSISKKRWPPVP